MKRILLGILAGLYLVTVVVLGFGKDDFFYFGISWFVWYGLPLWDDVRKRCHAIENAQFVRYTELWAGSRRQL